MGYQKPLKAGIKYANGMTSINDDHVRLRVTPTALLVATEKWWAGNMWLHLKTTKSSNIVYIVYMPKF